MMNLTLDHEASQPLDVLCLGAHCDDIEIGCGGTILDLAANASTSITWVVFSSSPDRASELERSAKAFLGEAPNRRLIVMEHRDGFLPYHGAAVKDDFEKLKTEHDPDLILTHYRHDLHQDHRLVCDLTWNTFRDHLILEYEIPKWDGDLGNPNVYRALSEETCRTKARNLLDCYASQKHRRWFTEDLFSALARIRGMECNAPSGFAEAFYGRKLRLEA